MSFGKVAATPFSFNPKSEMERRGWVVVPVGHFRPAGALDFPVRGSAEPGDWKVARTGRLESLPDADAAADASECRFSPSNQSSEPD
jgi:hypothetical protein